MLILLKKFNMKLKILNSIPIMILGIGVLSNAIKNYHQDKDVIDLYQNDLKFAKQDKKLLDIHSVTYDKLKELFDYINNN